MTVAVEDKGHRGDTSACFDFQRICARGDPECDCGVTKVVRSKRGKSGGFDSRLPETLTPLIERHGSTLRCGKNQVVWSMTPLAQVGAQRLRCDPGNWHGAPGSTSLGWTKDEMAADISHDFDDSHGGLAGVRNRSGPRILRGRLLEPVLPASVHCGWCRSGLRGLLTAHSTVALTRFAPDPTTLKSDPSDRTGPKAHWLTPTDKGSVSGGPRSAP